MSLPMQAQLHLWSRMPNIFHHRSLF